MVIFLMPFSICGYIFYFFFLRNIISPTALVLEKILHPIARDQIKNLIFGGEDEG